jgi:hypothetical protein
MEDENTGTEIIRVDATPVVRAEIDSMVATAKMYPRKLAKIKQDIEGLACMDPETAESCFYSLPRGGKAIVGPSVRFAEIITYCWEHIRVESRVSLVGETKLTCEAVAWDMEKNISVRKTVDRKIVDKYGKKYKEDMIIMTGNAGCAIAERNAIFKLIPPAVLKNTMDKIKKKAMEGFGDLEKSRSSALKYFEDNGIPAEYVLAKVDKRRITELTEEDIFVLRSLISSAKESSKDLKAYFDMDDKIMTTSEEVFSGGGGKRLSDVKKPAKKKPAKKKVESESEPEPEKEKEVEVQVTEEEMEIF